MNPFSNLESISPAKSKKVNTGVKVPETMLIKNESTSVITLSENAEDDDDEEDSSIDHLSGVEISPRHGLISVQLKKTTFNSPDIKT